MRGVFWKWLFSFGFIFWAALCVTDYYKKNIEMHPEYLDKSFIEEELQRSVVSLPIKKEPPALTFWKTLSMILSVGALVYIKRCSSAKKHNKPKLMLSYPIHEDYNKILHPIRSYSSALLYPKFSDLKSNQISPDSYSNTTGTTISSRPTTPIPGLFGVEIVQKKLETLEKSVASLKQRHQGTGNSSYGIVSGSPEFRKFLSTCRSVHRNSEVSINTSELSETTHVPGTGLISTTSSSEALLRQKSRHVVNSSTSSSSLQNTVIYNPIKTVSFEKIPEEVKEAVSGNSSGNTNDSSWTTISDDVLDPVTEGEPQQAASSITDILQIKDTFSKSSKTSDASEVSVVSEVCSVGSVRSGAAPLRVPGSTLVSTSSTASPASSATLLSTSSNTVTWLFEENSVYSFEDDVLLNTLD